MLKVLVLLSVNLTFGQSVEPPKSYVLGPNDQVVIRALDADEISNSPFRIDLRGYISVPLAGSIHAAGLTPDQLEEAVASRLREYLRNPVVTVSIVEYGSQPVSIVGAVNNPGVHQLRGNKTLVQVIAEAGGLKNEAGNSIKITRGKGRGQIPLSGMSIDSSGQYFTAEVGIKSLMAARDPQQNIPIEAGDIISVPRADLIYVIGAVKRSGGFVLNEREHMSVLQALSMAEGLDRLAAAANARILRTQGSTASRKEIPVDVNKILEGKSNDLQMLSDDILFIPNSAAKGAAMRSLEAAIQLGTGVAIYRR